MTAQPTPSNIHHFSSIEAPSVNRQKKHQLQDIFFISICAIICGADNWAAVEEFGLAKEEWLTELLGLEHGIPAYETIGEVYAAIDTDKLSICFSRWVAGAEYRERTTRGRNKDVLNDLAARKAGNRTTPARMGV
jgi:hypothetical protein